MNQENLKTSSHNKFDHTYTQHCLWNEQLWKNNQASENKWWPWIEYRIVTMVMILIMNEENANRSFCLHEPVFLSSTLAYVFFFLLKSPNLSIYYHYLPLLSIIHLTPGEFFFSFFSFQNKKFENWNWWGMKNKSITKELRKQIKVEIQLFFQ